MSRPAKILAWVAAALLALGASAYSVLQSNLIGRGYDWRQEITFVVRTPEGDKTASGITQINARYWRNGEFLTARARDTDVIGEAIPLWLDDDTLVVMLMTGGLFATQLVAEGGAERQSEAAMRRLSRARRIPPQPVDEPHRGRFVTFTDAMDPLTVTEVPSDDFASVFGPGYELSLVSVAITPDPVTTGRIMSVLPWLEDLYGKTLAGSEYRRVSEIAPLAHALYSSAFFKGFRPDDDK